MTNPMDIKERTTKHRTIAESHNWKQSTQITNNKTNALERTEN